MISTGLRRSLCAPMLLALLVSGCSRRDEADTAREREATPPAAERETPRATEPEMASVRFVNTYKDNVDLYFGDQKLFTGVAYRSVSPYQQVQEDWARFKLLPAGKDTAQPLATNIERVGDGTRYTIVAITKEDGSPTLRAFKDDDTAATDAAMVRVVHAAPGVGDVDVVPAGKQEALFDGVNAATVADFRSVQPMKGSLEVRDDSSNRVLARIPNANFEAGRKYTFVVTGRGKGALDVIRLSDETAGTEAARTQPMDRTGTRARDAAR